MCCKRREHHRQQRRRHKRRERRRQQRRRRRRPRKMKRYALESLPTGEVKRTHAQRARRGAHQRGRDTLHTGGTDGVVADEAEKRRHMPCAEDILTRPSPATSPLASPFEHGDPPSTWGEAPPAATHIACHVLPKSRCPRRCCPPSHLPAAWTIPPKRACAPTGQDAVASRGSSRCWWNRTPVFEGRCTTARASNLQPQNA